MCIPHKRGKAAPAPSLTLREVHLENLCICMQFPRTENLIWFLHCENIAKTEFEIELGIWWMLILGSFAVTRLRARPLQGLLSSQSMLVMLPHDMLPLATSYLPTPPLSHPAPSINTLMGLFYISPYLSLPSVILSYLAIWKAFLPNAGHLGLVFSHFCQV